jgi:hypothetical protein
MWDNFLDFGRLPGMVENIFIGDPVARIDQRFGLCVASIQTGQICQYNYPSIRKQDHSSPEKCLHFRSEQTTCWGFGRHS